MHSSIGSRRRLANALRSTRPAPPPVVEPPAPTEDEPHELWRLWLGILTGLAITFLIGALGAWLVGCTIERVVLYETVNYPEARVTASAAVYPHARTP